MIESLIAEERKAWIESLDGVEQPTCDLVDGLLEEALAETTYDDLTGKVFVFYRTCTQEGRSVKF